jgi:hypothetical protein
VVGSTAQIALKRLRRPVGDVLRTYKVVIDGTAVGDIRRGETKTFDVPPGQHEIHLEIADGSWLAVADPFSPEPPSAPELDPGAPDDEEMQAAWEAWSESSERATDLRSELQSAIRAGNDDEIARIKQEVGVVLAEHRTLTEEYNNLKAERPDWKAPHSR